MSTDGELAGVVADNHPLTQELVGMDAAPQRALSRNLDRVWDDPQHGDAKPLEMRLPARRVGKLLVRVFRQAGDDGPGERTLAHVAQRRLVDHVIGMSGTQQIEEVRVLQKLGRRKQYVKPTV